MRLDKIPEFMHYLGGLEGDYKLPAGLLGAVMRVESAGQNDARSPVGARGAFQFMPATAREYNINPLDPIESADGAARYLRKSLDKFGNIEEAVASYNAGSGRIAKTGVKGAPRETRNYLSRVMDFLIPAAEASESEMRPVAAKSVPAAAEDAEFASMSTEELEAMAWPNGKGAPSPSPAGGGPAAGDDEFASMSVEELEAMAGITPPRQFDDMPALDQGANTPAPPPAPDRWGATISGVNSGVASVLGLPVETAKNVVNLGIAGVGTVATAVGRPDLAPGVIEHTPGDIESFKGLLKGSGIRTDNPNPEDLSSRVLHGAGMGVGSSVAGPASGARRAATEIARIVTPGAAAGTGAAVGHEVAPESTAAPLIGALVPGAASQTAAATVRGAVRGGPAGRQAMQREIRAFKDAGTTPSLGQATGGRGMRGTENTLGSTPGGSGIMASKAEQQAGDVGARVAREVDAVSTRIGPDVAGNVIKGGIAGPGGFVERFRGTSRQLYNEVDRHLPPDLRVPPQATAAKLEELTTPIQGAENVSGGLQNPKVARIREDLTADLAANNGVLPYQGLKELRTKVGSMLESSELLSDIPKAQIKQLYGALTDDMRAAATQAGPQALKAFERANQYTAAGHKRIEDHLESIASKVDAEDVYLASVSGTKEGASKLQAVKRSLKPEEFRVVAATALNRLGRATPGKQNEIGEHFSTETFLTNWNRMSPKARTELLSGYSGAGQIDHSLTAVAKMAANVREGSKIWANPSGTSGGLYSKLGAGGLAYTAATGQFKAAGLILTGMGAVNIGARTLTNPNVVKWIAEATKMPPSALPAHLTRLAAIAAREKDPEEKAETEQLFQAVKQQLESEKPGPVDGK